VRESLLEQVVYSQPLPALIAFFIVGGIFYMGRILSPVLFSDKPSAIEVGASYIIVVMMIGFLGDAYLHSVIPLIVLKIVGVILSISGVLLVLKTNVVLLFVKFIKRWRLQSAYYKFSTLIVLSIITSLFLSSLAPPTDADSLDYHLGLPLAWLDNGMYAPYYNWFSARLSGLGERIILFGLANGTDVLSSLIQWSGLIISIVSLNSLSNNKSYQDLLMASLLVLSAPVILFLVLNQKPYLFPAASIVLASSLYFKDNRQTTIKLSVIGFILVSSVLFKYTFLLSVFGVLLIMLYDSMFLNRSKKLFYILLVFFIVLMVPYYTRNYIYFGDPLSPLFSSVVPDPNLVLIEFMETLKTGYVFNVENVLKIPFTQGVITLSPNMISTIVGLGGVFILIAIRSPIRKSRLLIIAFLISFAVIAILGRPISRLMFDVYLFGGAALVVSEFGRYKDITIKALSLQSVGVLLLSLYSVYELFPGVFSDRYRDVVLFNNANGYSASKELGPLLPADAVLLTDIRSKSLLPSKVILADAFQYANSVSEVDNIILSENSNNKITHVALLAFNHDYYNSIMNCADKKTEKFINTTKATRNPLNRKNYQFVFFKINEKESCFLNS